MSVDELFERGMLRFGEQQYALAAADLETAGASAPDQPLAALALYQAGLARDLTGEFSACAEDFKKVVHSPAAPPQRRDARVRLVRVLVYLERWKEAGLESEALLGEGLRPIEAIVARGARAMAEIEEGELDRAERDIEGARSIVEEQQFQLPAKIHRDIAVVYYALGELRRKRASAIRFVPPSAIFSAKLEQRCQLLLDAQSAYSNSMRAYDAHWSVMAGYRVGELYAELHADLMELLGALSFDSPERARIFEAALRLRYSVLLSKALTLMDHTLTLAARNHDDSQWVRLTRESHRRLSESLSKERAALATVPYTREEMNAALNNLGRSVQSKEKPPTARPHP
jgi:tetratricopeptide (TPR) repeat protein